ncbi:hypothetical protein quinque_001034 [Culex quinquefasciatus]
MSSSTAASGSAGGGPVLPGATPMETDDLADTMNDFLPLLPENIKQELFESSADKAASASGSSGAGSSSSAAVCDSAENKVCTLNPV